MATVEQDVRMQSGTFEDLDAVMEIMHSAFGRRFGEAWTRSQLAGILPMSGVSLVIALEPRTNTAVGFSLVRTVADEAELLLLAVLPAHHRRGVGARLLDDFLKRARNDGVARVHLEVRDGNPAVGMYRNAGFSPVGRRRNYYHAPNGKRFDAITLAHEF
ncbi:MAG TPA: GNAT family N-acetyltransferase [Sphingomicrobium sp.]|nr:GNAT family N-acetyltransferase [Sphingomicrobium sp.]